MYNRFVYLPVCVIFFFSICLSVHLPIYLFIFLFIYLLFIFYSISLSLSLSLSFFLPFSLYNLLSICLLIYLSKIEHIFLTWSYNQKVTDTGSTIVFPWNACKRIRTKWIIHNYRFLTRNFKFFLRVFHYHYSKFLVKFRTYFFRHGNTSVRPSGIANLPWCK